MINLRNGERKFLDVFVRCVRCRAKVYRTQIEFENERYGERLNEWADGQAGKACAKSQIKSRNCKENKRENLLTLNQTLLGCDEIVCSMTNN